MADLTLNKTKTMELKQYLLLSFMLTLGFIIGFIVRDKDRTKHKVKYCEPICSINDLEGDETQLKCCKCGRII